MNSFRSSVSTVLLTTGFLALCFLIGREKNISRESEEGRILEERLRLCRLRRLLLEEEAKVANLAERNPSELEDTEALLRLVRAKRLLAEEEARLTRLMQAP